METKNPSKILVVDDDPRLRDLLRRYLGEQGFNVYVAENAPSMNKLWVRERFDLLVLDLMLPGEDGLSIWNFQSRTTSILSITALVTFVTSAGTVCQ